MLADELRCTFNALSFITIFFLIGIAAEMALEAVEHGVDGIIVSNHGGRQLDGVFATVCRNRYNVINRDLKGKNVFLRLMLCLKLLKPSMVDVKFTWTVV